MGIEISFVNPSDPQAFKNTTDDKTRAYYGETLLNPKIKSITFYRSDWDSNDAWNTIDYR